VRHLPGKIKEPACRQGCRRIAYSATPQIDYPTRCHAQTSRAGAEWVAALPLALIGISPGNVALAASGDCTTSGTRQTCTYTYTGAAQTWTVPAGVNSFNAFQASRTTELVEAVVAS
jgi:hypothetical protein